MCRCSIQIQLAVRTLLYFNRWYFAIRLPFRIILPWTRVYTAVVCGYASIRSFNVITTRTVSAPRPNFWKTVWAVINSISDWLIAVHYGCSRVHIITISRKDALTIRADTCPKNYDSQSIHPSSACNFMFIMYIARKSYNSHKSTAARAGRGEKHSTAIIVITSLNIHRYALRVLSARCAVSSEIIIFDFRFTVHKWHFKYKLYIRRNAYAVYLMYTHGRARIYLIIYSLVENEK